ncbi:hypothetical protein HNP82_002544 [Catenibacillus scindens]|uniref:Uncharacterized protein n=1 Tax=Catenibacillus scindens TaxID=673271 RepID=A0A7W8HCD5_9FIRM|nr:hypothetical protein [Catenibacillus scindens]MBB5265398.1 hypothetical protein [Catenibacillus scindens]
MKKFLATLLVLVLAMSFSFSAFAATNKKESILSEMMAAATELGVQNSVTFQNAYASVANYEGTITDEQYEAALAEIQTIKDAIASKGVEAFQKDPSLKDELAAHVIAACEAVGITVVYEGNGIGSVSFNNGTGTYGPGTGTDGSSQGNVSSPIKQTGLDYAPFMLMAAGIVLVFGGCVAFARKKQLFV